jgi:hypothetical protein
MEEVMRKSLTPVVSALALLASAGAATAADVCNGSAPCSESGSTNGPTVAVTNASTAANATAVTGRMSSASAGNVSAAVRGINEGRGFFNVEPGGQSTIPIGVWGSATNGVGIGVRGESQNGDGVLGRGSVGVRGDGTGIGVVGNGSRNGVNASSGGGGVAVSGFNGSLQGNAATLQKGSGAEPGTLAAVEVLNTAAGGEGLWLALGNAANPHAALKLVVPPTGQNNFLECHRGDGNRRCRITSAGTFVSGSDFAEALPALEGPGRHAPGDVLVMARDGAGVEATTEPYSRRLVGVHSTRPGVLGADKDGETRVDPGDVPVAVLGIVPTRVSGENGSIEVGDLLVTSSTSGHAMKGTDPDRMLGATVGKALEPMEEDAGVVRVLVSLR